jgi:hydrogenase expression/formation protein HypC
MKVVSLKEGNVALVEMEGLEREVCLDIVDSLPREGDFVLVHAGFAIHRMDPEEGERQLAEMERLLRG